MVENPWHVLHVAANHEKRVVQHLQVHSVEHYLPLYTEVSRWSDRAVRLERPLFAGYVFIRYSPRERLPIVSIPGVLHLLGGNGLDTVSADEINRIQAALKDGYSLRPHPWVNVGTNVRVRGGVFDGAQGIVTELRGQCKVVIALAAVRQCFSLEVPVEQLEKIEIPARATSHRQTLHAYH
jgi:transcription antitermination factor NusG